MSSNIPKAIVCYFDDRPTRVIERKEEKCDDDAMLREFARHFIAKNRRYILECQKNGVPLGETMIESEAVEG